jgi:hypothetical protein
MKVREGGVEHNKYDGYCVQQWINIPNATWTLLDLGKRSTCWTFFNKIFFMRDDLNDEVPNGTLKILISFDGVLN